MFKDLLFTLIFVIPVHIDIWFSRKWERAKDIFFIHVWHRRHIFNFKSFHEGDNIYDCVCMFCPRTLKSVTEDAKPHWRTVLLLFIFCGFARAAEFDQAQIDEGFFYDSTYQVRVYAESTDCSKPRFPCSLRIEDGDGWGQGETVNAVGRPGDTLKLACAFRRVQLQAESKTASLTFSDAAGKVLATATVKMGFKDPRPPTSLFHAKPRARPVLVLPCGYRADGRVRP